MSENAHLFHTHPHCQHTYSVSVDLPGKEPSSSSRLVNEASGPATALRTLSTVVALCEEVLLAAKETNAQLRTISDTPIDTECTPAHLDPRVELVLLRSPLGALLPLSLFTATTLLSTHGSYLSKTAETLLRPLVRKLTSVQATVSRLASLLPPSDQSKQAAVGASAGTGEMTVEKEFESSHPYTSNLNDNTEVK